MEWHYRNEGKVYISFSGGKDSTVLLDLARRCFPDIPAVFVDTGLEYPEIRDFALSRENVKRIRPKLTFLEVVKQYGYPVISKEVAKYIYYFRKGKPWAINGMNGLNKDGTESDFKARFIKFLYLTEAPFCISNECCNYMKIYPLDKYERETGRKSITGIMACESQQREAGWMKTGCNAFEAGTSKPMSFWLENDVMQYLKYFNIQYSCVYGDIVAADAQLSLFDIEGNEPDSPATPEDYYRKFEADTSKRLKTTACDRTGCMFCMFGIMHDKTPNRFQRMKQTHPRLYEHCINGGYIDENGYLQPDKNGLGIGKVLDFIGIPY